MLEETLIKNSLIVSIIISFLVGFFYVKKHWDTDTSILDNLLSSIGIMVFSIVISIFASLIIVCGVIGIYSLFVDHNEVEKHYVYPVSINREKDVEGEFILGSGSVESVNYYYFYYETIYGYKLSKIESNNTYIVETNKRKPQIVEVVKSYNQNSFLKLSDSKEPLRVIIYVPKNTIIKNFSLK